MKWAVFKFTLSNFHSNLKSHKSLYRLMTQHLDVGQEVKNPEFRS